jgi:Domain of unknown function (DUF4123)
MSISPQYSTYLLLDASRMEIEDMQYAKAINKNHISLYRERNEEKLADTAPYMFEYIAESAFEQWVNAQSWKRYCGILIETADEPNEVHRHLRKFLIVQDEDGKKLYFKYYSPRVLRIFLPTCDTQQLAEFFGPIKFFFMEDEDPNFALKFSLENGKLQTERIKQNLSITV